MANVPVDEDTVIVLNGDIITSQDPAEVLNRHLERKLACPELLATIMVSPMISPYGLVDMNDEGDVVGFREKVELPHWINAGVYVLERRLWPLLPEVGDHEVLTFPDLAANGRIAAFKSRSFWRSVDSFKDLNEAEEYVKQLELEPDSVTRGLLE
ncbi:MAG: hypothetical protein F4X65_14625 [Chloroflexi bacterium]|nr:hypothetical protein [Chloroflexota bacterium]